MPLASLDKKAWWEAMEMLEIFAYCTVAFMHFTDQNWIPKTVYCIRCVMVCKIRFTNWNAKIALLRASMAVSYYIIHFRTGGDRQKGILMSFFLLVAETISTEKLSLSYKFINKKYHDMKKLSVTNKQTWFLFRTFQ